MSAILHFFETREDLSAKRREIEAQIKAIQHKIDSIDVVLELFPATELRKAAQ